MAISLKGNPVPPMLVMVLLTCSFGWLFFSPSSFQDVVFPDILILCTVIFCHTTLSWYFSSVFTLTSFKMKFPRPWTPLPHLLRLVHLRSPTAVKRWPPPPSAPCSAVCPLWLPAPASLLTSPLIRHSIWTSWVLVPWSLGSCWISHPLGFLSQMHWLQQHPQGSTTRSFLRKATRGYREHRSWLQAERRRAACDRRGCWGAEPGAGRTGISAAGGAPMTS